MACFSRIFTSIESELNKAKSLFSTFVFRAEQFDSIYAETRASIDTVSTLTNSNNK